MEAKVRLVAKTGVFFLSLSSPLSYPRYVFPSLNLHADIIYSLSFFLFVRVLVVPT